MKPGARVAVVSADGKKFVGWGVYEGDEDCEKLRLMLAAAARGQAEAYLKMAEGYETGKFQKLNPKMKMDDGREVWGCECWWGDAGEFVKSGKAKEYGVGKAPGRPRRKG